MTIKLRSLNPKGYFGGTKTIILYGDFNVLNFIYEEGLKIPDGVIVYPDSTAIWLLLKFIFGYNIRKSISTDIQEEILSDASELKKRIFFFGDTDQVLVKTGSQIKNEYCNIIIAGMQSGYNYDDTQTIENINLAAADILFVGLGVTRQEKWILKNINYLNVPLIVSVGGWFQYLAGNKHRAPKYMRKLNLEWMYKLSKEFNRVWRRYFIILPKFLFRIVLGTIHLELTE